MSQELEKAGPPEITNDEANAALRALKLHVSLEDIQAYKVVGTWLVSQDINAVKLAQTFDSDEQIKLAIEVSRELAQHEDPEIRSKGVQGLLASVKARSQVAQQSMRLAESAGLNKKDRGRNLPPTFNGSVYLNVTAAPVAEQPAKAVDI